MPTDPSPDSTLDRLPAAVFRVDREYRHLAANHLLCTELARPADQIVGRTLDDLSFPPNLTELFRGRLDHVFGTGEPTEFDFPFDGPAGPRHILTRLVPEPGPDGRVETVLGAATDVTAFQQTEAARRDSEALFREFMAHLPLDAWMKDAAGRYVFVNRQLELSPPPGGWVGKTDADVFPPEVARTFRENDLRVLGSGSALRVEEVAPGPNGEPEQWLSIKFPFTDSAGRSFVGGVAVDLSEKKKHEEERKRAAQILHSQKLESLGLLAGGIAHDFNNLLTAILGFASLARMTLPDPGPASEPLARIEQSALRAADLCQQMLAYAGRGQFTVRPLGLNKLVEEMAQLLATAVGKKAVLKFYLTQNLPSVEADPTQLRQVVMNLITNAADAIGALSGVITLTTGVVDADGKYLNEVNAPELPAGRYVYLEVADTGVGMDEATRGRIFDPFFTTKFTGRGLGLAAVLGIVRSHHGAIKVYSEPGRGTTFKVLLPASDRDPAEVTPGTNGFGTFGRGRTVLVVDDEEDIRLIARVVLEQAGFAVELAGDGHAGAEAFRADPGRFAAVVLDLTMPKLGGADAFREFRRARADVRVVLMSGFAEEEATAGFEGKGLAGFVRKPFRAQELLAAVFAAVGP